MFVIKNRRKKTSIHKHPPTPTPYTFFYLSKVEESSYLGSFDWNDRKSVEIETMGL
jgi:hypothetical protein